MKKVYFLCLNALQFVPYAYGFLRSHAEQTPRIAENYAWQEPLHRVETINEIVSHITDPEVLLASCYVWNHNQHAAIARRVKETYPDCRIVFGGPHVPDQSTDYFTAHPYVDVLVHGEGEIPLTGLLVALLDPEPDFSSIANISYNDGGRGVRTAPGKGLPKELPVPSPYLNGLLDEFLDDGRPNKIGLWETNRGCPYACTFCDWGVRTMNKLRFHDLGKVRQEVDAIAAHKLEDIYVTDCNFGLFDRDLEITRMLVESRRNTGYPKRVRIQFAKLSNKTVFEVSRLLHENDMLWGTTLSMQSVNPQVLKAVNRQHMGIENYRKLADRYAGVGIPTYTELILGLPLETRESFVQGICTLFEIGLHDDQRVYELALLPNAPLSRPEEREKYGLQTQHRPLRLTREGVEKEYVELVFGTRTMPHADWAYSLLFGEATQALHNGAFTRFLSIYLHREGILSYRKFYDGLLMFLLETDAVSGTPFKRIRRLIDDFYNDPDMAQINRLLTQPDIMEFLLSFNPKRKGWQIWTYLWLSISEGREAFYADVIDFLGRQGIEPDRRLVDLLRYQEEIMLTPLYDPEKGKDVEYAFNWFDYFFNGDEVREKRTAYHYGDTRMGVSHRYPIETGDRKSFVNAAMGISYPYSKFRHFYHQPDQTKVVR